MLPLAWMSRSRAAGRGWWCRLSVLLAVSGIGCPHGLELAGDGRNGDGEAGDPGMDIVASVCGNGVVEPGEECDGDPLRPCATACSTSGVRACAECRWESTCAPPPETCNGRDDNCDTICDEGFECCAGATGRCDGGCRTCSASCSWDACGAPREEWCDGLDDDCDGRADDEVWCWLNPQPTGLAVLDLWAASPSDTWAVDGTRLLHWNGSRWSALPPAREQSPLALWGRSGDDVWEVHGAGSASASDGTLHWDGSDWVAVSLDVPVLVQAIGGCATDDVWVAGYMGAAAHWDGASWSATHTGSTARLQAVWANSRDDVWAVGDEALHWDGATWSRADVPMGERLVDVFGFASDDVWAVGSTYDLVLHWDGTAWSAVPARGVDRLYALWGASPEDLWAAGAAVMHWDGLAWSDVTAEVPSLVPEAYGLEIRAVHGTSASDVWLGGLPGALVHRSDGRWSALSSGTAYLAWLQDVWVSGGGELWAVGWDEWDGGAAVIRCDEARCSEVPVDLDGGLTAVWGFASDDVWVAGWRHEESFSHGALLHWDGRAWSSVSGAPDSVLSDLWGCAADDVWAVGEDGVVVHRTGGASWGSVRAPTDASLSSVWGISRDDVWVAGNEPATVLRWDGSSWTETWHEGWVPQINVVWGLSGDDVRFGDLEGDIYHWDGTSWSREYAPESRADSITDICGSSPVDVWAVGSGGLLLHWNGTRWTKQPSGALGYLDGLWCGPGGGAWAVGDYGTILRRNP